MIPELLTVLLPTVLLPTVLLPTLPLAPTAPADLILRSGAIYTVDSKNPSAEALAIEDGVLVYVGPNQGVQAFQGPATRVIDLGGRMVMPGIHDSHVHLLEANHAAAGTCLLPSGRPLASHIPRLQQCAPNQVGTDWVLGFGHSIFDLLDHLANGGVPPRTILDQAIPDRPVAILEETSHSVWANSLALTAAGFETGTPDPPGGVILRDPSTGQPNGVLLDGAGEILMDLALAPNPVLDELNDQALFDGMALMSRHGITSVADARAYWRRGYVEAWQRAEAADSLTVRAVVGLWGYPYLDDTEQIAALGSMFSNDPASKLRFSQVKIYTDGEISHTTAALLEPYLAFPLAGDLGLEYFDPSRLTRYISELESVGFDFHIHAIGDRGVRHALDAIAAAEAANCSGATRGARCGDRRHRLTHIELVHPDDVPRFSELDVIADIQMSSPYVEPQHLFDNELVLGRPRIEERLWRLRDLHDSGARVVLSSDYDVGDLSPFKGMERALTRGEQSLPNVDAAIRAYTINPAYLMRQEDRAGSLAVGKIADLIVLDQNLFEVDLSTLGTTRVLLTLLGGQEVWRDGSVSFAEGEVFADGFETGDTTRWSMP